MPMRVGHASSDRTAWRRSFRLGRSCHCSRANAIFRDRSLEVLGLADMPSYRASVAAIDVPITLMTGALDPKFSEIARALAEENAHVDNVVVEGAGHNVVLEAPAAVAAAMNRMAKRVGR